MKKWVKGMLTSVCLLGTLWGPCHAFEFNDYKQRLLTMNLEIMYGDGGDYRRDYSRGEVEAGVQRLQHYVTSNPVWQAGAVVVTAVFLPERWVVRVYANYDSVIAPLPSLSALSDAYAHLEAFVHNDAVLSSTCWYAGFSQGEHGE